MKAFFLTLWRGLGLAKRVSKLDCIKKNSLCAIWLTIDHWPPMVKRCSAQKNAIQTLPHSEGFQTDPILKPSHAHNCRPHPYAAASNVRPHHRTSWEGHVLHRILSVHFRSCQPKMPLLVRVQDAVGISLALFHTQGAKVWGARPETTLKTIPTNLTFSHTQLVHRSHQATSSRWTPGNALVVHRLSSSLAFQRAAGSLVPRCTEGVEVMNRPALCQDKCSYHRYVLKYICIYVVQYIYIYINIYLQSVYCSMHLKKNLPCTSLQ